jgi:hypothetical protein
VRKDASGEAKPKKSLVSNRSFGSRSGKYLQQSLQQTSSAANLHSSSMIVPLQKRSVVAPQILVDQADLEMTGENGSDIGSHLIQKSGES